MERNKPGYVLLLKLKNLTQATELDGQIKNKKQAYFGTMSTKKKKRKYTPLNMIFITSHNETASP